MVTTASTHDAASMTTPNNILVEEEDEHNTIPDNSPIPSSFYCTITHEIMKDPVILSDGFTYERGAVATWLSTSKNSPKTGLPLRNLDIVANHNLRQAIRDLCRVETATFSSAKTYTSTAAAVVPDDVGIVVVARSLPVFLPTAGSLYAGMFEQVFESPPLFAKSIWNVNLRIVTCDDYLDAEEIEAEVAFTWQKHTQIFDPDPYSSVNEGDTATTTTTTGNRRIVLNMTNDRDAAEGERRERFSSSTMAWVNMLRGNLGKTYTSRARGLLSKSSGVMTLTSYGSAPVGNGHYRLFFRASGSCEGTFELPHVRLQSGEQISMVAGTGLLRAERCDDE